MYFMAKKSKQGAPLNVLHQGPVAASDAIEGADKLNHSKWLAFFSLVASFYFIAYTRHLYYPKQ